MGKKKKKKHKYCVPSADSVIGHQLLCFQTFCLCCLCDERSIIDGLSLSPSLLLDFNSARSIRNSLSHHFDRHFFAQFGSAPLKTCFQYCYFDDPDFYFYTHTHLRYIYIFKIQALETSVRKSYCMIASTFMHHEACFKCKKETN